MKTYTPNGQAPPARRFDDSPYAAVLSDHDLDAEQKKRRKGLLFPLDVFPRRVQPLIAMLIDEMHGERAFIGLTLLQASASAIGSALRVRMGTWEVCCAMWGACVGISSSGKSMMQGVLLRPLNEIQDKYNRDYIQQCRDQQDDRDAPLPNQKVLMYQDTTFEALIKDILSSNYKGVTRYEDELLKWIDDMDRYKTGKSEASFWTSAWSPASSFTMRRTGGKMIFIEKNHLVASIIGSTQPDVIYRFYEQNRLQTGYIFRMLWAFPETDRVISPNLAFELTPELTGPYRDMISRLYYDLPMNYADDEPVVAKISAGGRAVFQAWQDRITVEINKMDNVSEKNVRAGIFGKIKEYALRIAMILKAMEWAAYMQDGKPTSIEDKYVINALRVADYFLESGWEAYLTAKNKVVVPIEVLEFAAQLKAYSYNQSELAKVLGQTRQNVSKKYKQWAERYPGAFGARNER